ncbi:MAG: type II toxin-antitoxin system Phd/YefM family antitoxin [Anaerolineales bacterium]|nr:type II toxin-antitoxin system Phd/YefM family antitoxin [Anaerolineales bacterium]
MITVTATQFRANLFDYLDQVAAGEIIIIQRNRKKIARLESLEPSNWRDKERPSIQFNVSPEELIKPIEDIWDEYI